MTTNDVIVSPQIPGQISRLLVNDGDPVKRDQLLAVITPDELRTDIDYYTHTAAGLGSQVTESEAAVRFQQQQTGDQIQQAEATLASTIAQEKSAEADRENARLVFERNQKMVAQDLVTTEAFDQARTAYDAARSKVDSLNKQIDAARSAVALARSNAEQIAMRQSQVQMNQHQRAAADAQRAKADVRLAYTELHAPIDGIVDVRAVRAGEVVTAGQPVVTLINPDDLWIRADVEETYIDRVRHRQPVDGPAAVRRRTARDDHLSRRRRGVRDPARRQPDQARYQDIRNPPARRQRRPHPRGRHDRVRAVAAPVSCAAWSHDRHARH